MKKRNPCIRYTSIVTRTVSKITTIETYFIRVRIPGQIKKIRNLCADESFHVLFDGVRFFNSKRKFILSELRYEFAL